MKKIFTTCFLIFLLLIALLYGLFLDLYWPDKWTLPYWFEALPSLSLFWRRCFVVSFIIIGASTCFWLNRDKPTT